MEYRHSQSKIERKTGINSTIGISAKGLEKKKERLENLKAEQSEAIKKSAPQMEQSQQETIPVNTGSNVGAKSESNKSARKGSEQVNITLNNNSNLFTAQGQKHMTDGKYITYSNSG